MAFFHETINLILFLNVFYTASAGNNDAPGSVHLSWSNFTYRFLCAVLVCSHGLFVAGRRVAQSRVQPLGCVERHEVVVDIFYHSINKRSEGLTHDNRSIALPGKKGKLHSRRISARMSAHFLPVLSAFRE